MALAIQFVLGFLAGSIGWRLFAGRWPWQEWSR